VLVVFSQGRTAEAELGENPGLTTNFIMEVTYSISGIFFNWGKPLVNWWHLGFYIPYVHYVAGTEEFDSSPYKKFAGKASTEFTIKKQGDFWHISVLILGFGFSLSHQTGY